MTRKQMIILGISSFVLILILVGFNRYTSIYNRNVQLKNEFKAQTDIVAGTYDMMWKTIQDKAGVASKYSEDFKSIYVPMIEGRYSKGDGSLMKWVTEHNPHFDVSLYKDLMQSIEALRQDFLRSQTRARDIAKEHDNLRQEFWSRIFIGNEKPLVYKMITSSKTQEVMKTGKDEYQPLFK